MAKAKRDLKPRKGEKGPVTFYRSDRFYSENGGWFFSTREEEELGPFDTREEAKEALEMHILLNSENEKLREERGLINIEERLH